MLVFLVVPGLEVKYFETLGMIMWVFMVEKETFCYEGKLLGVLPRAS